MTPAQPDFLSALLAIILIDLVLAGDNAIIIGIAARNVPKDKQRAVILWGTAGAIAVRVLLTGAVVWLLKIPGFLLVGGAALIWIGWKLTAPQDSSPEKIAAAATFGAAVRTIVIADAVMGVDNVLAVGGAAQGSFVLVILGLVISIPIVVWGSALVLKLVDRYPAIMWVGAAVIGWTAAKMIGGEPLLADLVHAAAVAADRAVHGDRRRSGRHSDVALVQFARASARSVAAGDDRLDQRVRLARGSHGHALRSVRARALGR